jgi:predicted ATPase
MNTPQIKIITEGFRAIDKAEIIIDGVTVVAGENGSGKSTISKLLYYLYKTASNYEALIARDLNFRLRNIERFLEIALSDLHSFSRERNTREEFQEIRDLRSRMETVDETEMFKWIGFIEKLENNYQSQLSLFKDDLPKRYGSRLKFIVKDILSENKMEDDGVSLPFQKIILLVKKFFEDSLEKIKSRPTSLFINELQQLYSEGSLPKTFEVYEFDEQIVSLTKKSLSIPYLIQNAIYIDTPMAMNIEFSDNDYWDDLNELLLKKSKQLGPTNLSNTIKNEILSGEVSLNESTPSKNDFTFKRNDGSVFQLLECATGVKAFGMIQLLLKNGAINSKTLLIIDEPESHLHPQWVIEYARLIVLLNKEVGVKFFIASHNPDMVSAIKHIASKEGIINNVNFYLAEKNANSYTYSYKNLENNIEPIFESFNIALDRINLYAS